MRTRMIPRCCAVLALAAAAACADSLPSAPPSPVGPAAPPSPELQRVECVGSRAEATVRCGAPGPSGARGDLLLGGQGSLVKLTSSLAGYGAGQFTFYLSVQNLIGQAIGTVDGTTAAPEGVRVFFVDPPVVTSGSGAITVVADGTGTFTAAGQPYYQYVQLLAPGATGFIKRWRLDMPATVTTFAFSLYVSAPVRYPDGWVDLGAATRTVPRGGTTPLAAVVRDRLGRALPGEPVTYASSAPATVAVDSAGTLTALALGTATITATSGVRTGRVTVTSARPVATVLLFGGGSLLVGTTGQVTPFLQDSSGGILSDRVVAYASSDTMRATVSATGLVTALAAGPVVITATSEGKSGSANLAVTTSPPGIVQLARMAAGANHTCALAAGGAAYCWGANHDGQLGNGSSGGTAADFRNVPTAVAGGLSFVSLVSGYYRSCGVTAAGAAYCWGSNEWGALGKGDTVHAVAPTPVSGGIAFSMLAAGAQHTCGLSTSGEAFCWGHNSFGQLGTAGGDSGVPAPVSTALRFASISTTWDHTCAVTAAGAAYCWGTNSQGALGNGMQTSSPTPVAVLGGLAFASVSAGMSYTCGVTTAGAGYCWGDNAFSQLGNGLATTANSSSVPVPVSGGITWAAIASGPRPTACGVSTGGAAYCWGRNDGGATLGTGGSIGSSTVPARVAGGLSYAALSSGSIQTCGLTTTSGHAYCWGTAQTGALGDGSYTSRAFPTPVAKGEVP